MGTYQQRRSFFRIYFLCILGSVGLLLSNCGKSGTNSQPAEQQVEKDTIPLENEPAQILFGINADSFEVVEGLSLIHI